MRHFTRLRPRTPDVRVRLADHVPAARGEAQVAHEQRRFGSVQEAPHAARSICDVAPGLDYSVAGRVALGDDLTSADALGVGVGPRNRSEARALAAAHLRQGALGMHELERVQQGECGLGDRAAVGVQICKAVLEEVTEQRIQRLFLVSSRVRGFRL